jgi:hypothetical protein
MGRLSLGLHFGGKDEKGRESTATATEMSQVSTPPLSPAPHLSSQRGSGFHLATPGTSYPNSRRNSGVNTRASSVFACSTEDFPTMRAYVVGDWLSGEQKLRMWSSGALGEGVFVKRSRGTYVACPKELEDVQGDIFDAVTKLNVPV